MTMTQAQPQAVQVPDEPVVQLSAAAAQVGGNTIWSGVDITVQHGEFVAILGPNGRRPAPVARCQVRGS